MNEYKDIRWKQRFINFEKSFNLLDQFVNIPLRSELEKAGIIKFLKLL